MTKEEVYDSQISPLMAQIISICKEHKIAMLADFTLDEDLGDARLFFLPMMPETAERSELLTEKPKRKVCSHSCPNDSCGRRCGLEKGHTGDHLSHDGYDITATWPN